MKWDVRALQLALEIEDEEMKVQLPSLYLNVAKCYEDLKRFNNALINYEAAFSFNGLLPHDGYGNMISSGISRGIERVTLS